jgi:6-phosphogluconolactonase/glucosamine-6-phosphate isomerase/deaminase
MSTKSSAKKIINRRKVGNNVWLGYPDGADSKSFAKSKPIFEFEVLETEEAVGRAMLDELIAYSKTKTGDIVIILLGGRGAQAMYKIINQSSPTGELDALLARLHVFTQDALAPMRMNNGLSFVRDFERLLGDQFFRKIKSFTPMNTETDDLEGELIKYLEKLESLGGIDIFFLGLGPEAAAASHLAYIKPGSGALSGDIAGVIPISESILEHHINKFKVGGSEISAADEAECRRATHILTLGPAAILGARKIVQSIVDASTAPAKRASFKRLIETELSGGESELERQLDENPGLWIRLHPKVRSLILPDVLSK